MFNKMFGFEHYLNQSVTSLLNCILLNARFTIYRHKIQKTKPIISSFLQMIKNAKTSEYYIAKRRNKSLKNYHYFFSVLLRNSPFMMCLVLNCFSVL